MNDNDFLNALSGEIERECERILTAKAGDVSRTHFNAAQWCQDIMFVDGIPQERAAKFLKEKFNISVVLLPVPEMNLILTEGYA